MLNRRILISFACILFARLATAQAPVPSSPDVEKRVDSILSKMTLEEKIDYIGGFNDFDIRSIPRLNLPAIKMSDGPVGVRNYGPATTMGGIALAATWDYELVRKLGSVLGDDARARGVHILLGPGVNIYRAPMAGRNFEYFGEDPFLASRTAVAYIE
jgi:beta-glucosidase